METNANLDYRAILDQKFKEISDKNPSFSLRAMAQMLEMSPAHLSRILNGKRTLSQTAGSKIARILKFDKSKTSLFLLLIEYHNSTGKNRELLLAQILKMRSKKKEYVLESDSFKIVSDWEYFAVLNLFDVRDFCSDPNWISKRLGISITRTMLVLNRLESLGAIRRLKNETLIKNPDFKLAATTDDLSSLAIKSHHKQISNLANEALVNLSPGEREFQALMMPFESDKLTAAKERIRQFIDDFNAEFATTSGSEVFQLSTQFFPITKKLNPINKGN